MTSLTGPRIDAPTITTRPPTPAGGVEDSSAFRPRLLQGLAASILERGFSESTIADVVRHAHTSRRTFYAEFDNKDACYVALLEASNESMRRQIAAAVDPKADWTVQIRQAVLAYVESVASEPGITLSWIRELPALGTRARTLQRGAMQALVQLLLQLVDNESFRRAGAGPLTPAMAMLLLGGLRELTATIVEDGGDIHDLTDVAVEAATALLGPRPGLR